MTTPGYIDPVIDAYKRDVDRSLIRENLKLTREQRLEKMLRLLEFQQELHRSHKARLRKKRV